MVSSLKELADGMLYVKQQPEFLHERLAKDDKRR
jgi:hypothetical protein